MCRVSEQNNYITLQQGPECTTMTRELCLQAENTLHTGDGEWTEGEDFLVDEHKVHGSFRQMGRNNKVHWEKAEKRITHTHTCTAPWNINGICLLTSYNNQQLSLFRDFREREFVLDWQPLYTWGTCAWPASTNTEAHSYVYLWLEIMTGQEQGNPISYLLSYLQQTLRATCACTAVKTSS